VLKFKDMMLFLQRYSKLIFYRYVIKTLFLAYNGFLHANFHFLMARHSVFI